MFRRTVPQTCLRRGGKSVELGQTRAQETRRGETVQGYTLYPEAQRRRSQKANASKQGGRTEWAEPEMRHAPLCLLILALFQYILAGTNAKASLFPHMLCLRYRSIVPHTNASEAHGRHPGCLRLLPATQGEGEESLWTAGPAYVG